MNNRARIIIIGLAAVLIGAPIVGRAYFFQAFRIPSAGMENSVRVGDRILVDKRIYGFPIPGITSRIFPQRLPIRGDVVVFRFPVNDPSEIHCGSVQRGKIFLKRVIGIPGDIVEVRNGSVLLNGQLLNEEVAVRNDPYREPESPHAKELSPERYQQLWQEHRLDMELDNHQRDFFGPVKVPPDSYFMLGDNRDHSCDSRYWGPVDKENVVGRASYVLAPSARMGPIK